MTSFKTPGGATVHMGGKAGLGLFGPKAAGGIAIDKNSDGTIDRAWGGGIKAGPLGVRGWSGTTGPEGTTVRGGGIGPLGAGGFAAHRGPNGTAVVGAGAGLFGAGALGAAWSRFL